MSRDTPERDGHVGEIREWPPGLALRLADLPVADEVREPAAPEVAPDPRRAVALQREPGHRGAHHPGDARDVAVVRVQDDPAAWLREPGDDRLHLGELGQGVDALEVHVVGRDVGDDARVVRLVADPAQEHAAARRLQDGDVEVVALEDRVRAPVAGPIARLDYLVADDDPVGRRRTHSLPGLAENVDHQPGRGGLPVRARDRDDRQAPVRVADPRGARTLRGRDPAAEPLIQASAARREVSRSSRPDVTLDQRQRRLRDRLRPVAEEPRPGQNPVPRVGGAMDRHGALGAVGMRASEPPDPVRQRRDAGRLRGPRHGDREPDEGVRLGLAPAVPGATPPDAHLDLGSRLEPVQVGSVEQADLDQAHGPARIATAPRRATLDFAA